MCTLAVYRDVSPAYPLIIAANRDEFYARDALGPCSWSDRPWLIAGRDLQAGGTWLGVRRHPRILAAGMLNRRPAGDEAAPAPGELSRGQLCLDVLEHDGVTPALESLDDAAVRDYGPFNLMLADLERAVVVDNADGVRITELETGMSVLTNLDVNDPRCPRLANSVPRFESVRDMVAAQASLSELVTGLKDVLGDHDNRIDPDDDSPLSRLCVHTPHYGTRSSSILVIDGDAELHYFHADGPPCSSDFERVQVGS